MTRARATSGLAALALLAGACGASQAQPTPEPITVWVGGDEPLEETIAEALEKTGTRDEPGRCSFVWGDVAVDPVEATPARFAWKGGSEAIDGYVLCDEAREAVLDDPRAGGTAKLYYHQGRLRMTRPGGVGSVEYDRTQVAERDPSKPVMAVFEADTSDETASTADVLDQLATVTDDFLFATWPLE